MKKSDKTAPEAGPLTTYGPELTAKICQRIANGESLREICKSEGMPSRATVLRWLQVHEEFRGHYAQAREAMAQKTGDIPRQPLTAEKVNTE